MTDVRLVTEADAAAIAELCASTAGVATAAVAAMVRACFDGLGLHRLEAGTLLHNAGSQQALRRNAFVLYGLAPRYIRIAGRWQDHALFQLLNDKVG